MKQNICPLLAALVLLACTGPVNKANTEEPKAPLSRTDSTSKNDQEPSIDYAYKIGRPDNWMIGPTENAQKALQALKDFENGKIGDCLKAFADTITLHLEGLDARLPKDSVKKLFETGRSQMKNMTITMYDFQSVQSKDGKEQWVTLWFKEKYQDDTNAWDSVSVVNDFKIENGKIVLLDEKMRHFGPRKM